MAHLVLGYPTLAESLRTAERYIRAGVQVLELQIPFSHPTADGPVITAACREAVRQGVTTADCLQAIGELRRRHPEQEMVVMSYVNRIYRFGFSHFAAEMTRLGIRYLIVPDLPPDDASARQIAAKDPKTGIHRSGSGPQLVPVLAANVSDRRLDELLAAGYDFFYLMSDFKITGSTFSLHPRLKAIIARIRSRTGGGVICEARAGDTSRQKIASGEGMSPLLRRDDTSSPGIGIGFGISTPEQARLAAEEADLAIIGSALIRAQEEGRLEIFLEELKNTFPVTTGCS